jgi:cytochrome c oxidase subunit IV
MSEKPKSHHQHLTHDQMMNTNPDEPFVKSSMTRQQELHVESHAPYIKVWAALAVFTAIEYFWAHIFKDSFGILLGGLLFWAIIKASMVGWYFMHLKFEGRWVYGMLVPAAILAMVFIFALYPDMALHPVTEENPPEDEASAPLHPGPNGSTLVARASGQVLWPLREG